MPMQVLMLGWEFPPFINGGLGTACYGLTRAMEHMDVNITMLLPAGSWGLKGEFHNCYELQSPPDDNPEHITFKVVPSSIPNPYAFKLSHPLRIRSAGAIGGYDGNLSERVEEYADRCVELIEEESFDIVHAHDWVTFPAGIALAEKLSKPLVVHVHATEYDRSGDSVNPKVYEIERKAMRSAAAIIAVSNYTADILAKQYGVDRDKISVVHNGIRPKASTQWDRISRNGEKIVLFLGRITGQKGPFCFVEAAEKVLTQFKNVKFIIAGWGDLAPEAINRVAAKGLGSKILFTGFLHGDQVQRAYQSADVYVMPSVSEPFGLTAVEAIQQDLPVIISKTTGVGEILQRGTVKIDFWDTEKMAETIIDLLSNPEMVKRLIEEGKEEIRNLTWEAAAEKCLSVYRRTISMSSEPISMSYS